jgi:ABC-type multidrug transport system permease subunit
VNWTFLRVAARKDLRRVSRDPWKLVLWLGVPLVIGTLMTSLMGGSDGPKPQALLYLDDQDDSFLSGALISAFSNEQVGGLVQVERLSREDGLARLNQNQGSAVLVIPAGFGQAVLEETPITLELLTNPAQRILPGILEELLALVSDAVFYLHRTIGEELKLMLDGPEPGEFTLADPKIGMIAIGINQTINSLSDYFDPLLIELESSVASDQPKAAAPEVGASSDLPASFYMLPSVLMMALFFLAQGLSEDFWSEREAGTLRRSACTPQKLSTLLAGKMLGVAAIFASIGVALFSVGYLYHDYLSWTTLPLAVFWWTSGGLALYLLLSLIQMLCTSRRGGSILTNLLMFPLLMMGGSFFPFEAMPSWMAEAGRFTPNGWILQELKPVILGKHQLLHLGAPFGALVAGGGLLTYLLRARLRRVVFVA